MLRYCIPTEGAFSLAVTGLDGQHLAGSPAVLAAFRSCTSSHDPTQDLACDLIQTGHALLDCAFSMPFAAVATWHLLCGGLHRRP